MKKRDSEYLKWVRSLNCESCNANGPSESHHLRGEFHLGGMAMKSPDWSAMALCPKCHTRWHNGQDKDRMEKQRLWLLRTLISAIQEGHLVAGDVEGPIW